MTPPPPLSAPPPSRLRPVVLVGFMGAGKSTVAGLLAARWEATWADSDVEIERRTGRTAAQIFAADGEEAFRDLEQQVVLDLLAAPLAVLSLGGGACGREATRRALAAVPVVHLVTSLATALGRVGDDPARPVLAKARQAQGLAALHAARSACYDQVAATAVTTDGRSPHEVADRVQDALMRLTARPGPY